MGLCLIYDIALIFSFESLYTDKEKIECTCEVISLKEETNYNNKYIVKSTENNTKLIVYTSKNNNFIPGDFLEIQGEFNKAEKQRNYKGFNYNNYLKQSKIYGSLEVSKINRLYTKKDIYYLRGQILINIIEKCHTIYTSKLYAFIESILFGYTEELEEELRESFNSASISHLLAISGMHLHYIVFGASILLRKFLKNKKIENLFLIAILIFFYFLTGENISCRRACIMYIISIMSFNTYRKYNFYRSYLMSIIIILFLNPFTFFSVGMWLSYLGILGIKLFYNFFKIIFNHLFKKVPNIILNNIALSISVQITIFPIILYNYNLLSVSFLLSNFLVVLFIDKILLLGYLSLFLSFINIDLGLFISRINEFLIKIFLSFIESLSSYKVYSKTPYFSSVVIYYVFLSLIYILSKRNKYFTLRLFCSKIFFKIQIDKLYRKIKNYVVFVILVIFFIIKTANFSNYLNIYFVDVGQGDCTFIKTPKGKSILIDSGEGNSDKYDYGKNVVLPYLLDRRVNKLDYIIISHFDSDHCGGAITLMQEIGVGKVIIGKQFEKSSNYEEFIKIAKEKRIEILTVLSGKRINIEKNIYLDVIFPDNENMIRENILNNNSLVFKFVYKDFSMLFTGDIEDVAEKAILKKYKNNLEILSTTVLKIAHHGSKTSSSKEFLEEVKPRISLIGVGINNIFGHPSDSTLKKLNALNCKIYRTDEDGEIWIKTDGKKLKIKTMVLTE